MPSLAGAALAQPHPDLVVVEAAAAEAGLLTFLEAPERAGLPLVVVAGDPDADAAGALLPFNVVAFLSPEDAEEALEPLVAAWARPAAERLAERRQDRYWSEQDRIAALERDAERVAKRLAELRLERAGDPAARRPVDAARIRAHIKARRLRERFFPADLFADPAWDILLDLAAAQREGIRVSVSSLCIAAAVPTTTGLRWIKAMVDRGMLVREPDPADARRAFIAMAPHTASAMDACMEACFNLPGL